MSQVEIWKDIPGFEGLYQASNRGNIKSLDKYVGYKDTGTALRKGKILSPKVTNTGYLEVVLMKNNVRCCRRVHRLVAITFIPNSFNYPCINHINEVKTDNRIENLEWCNSKQNNDAYYTQRTKIYQYDLQGNLIKEWDSITNASNSVGINKTGIQHCCKGILKTFYGYIWTYFPLNPSELKRRTTNNNLVSIAQYDQRGIRIATYESMSAAARTIGCNSSAISMACNGLRKTIKGYIWKKV